MQADAARHGSGEVDGGGTGVDVDCCNDGETALTRLGTLLAGPAKSLKRLDRKILSNNSSAR